MFVLQLFEDLGDINELEDIEDYETWVTLAACRFTLDLRQSLRVEIESLGFETSKYMHWIQTRQLC